MSEEATLEEFRDKSEGDQRQDWRKVKLGEVSWKRSENVDPQEVDLDRHVGLEHIEPNTPSPKWEPLDDLSSTKRRFRSGDILFAKLRPNLEKSAQPDFEGVSSTDIFPIVAEQGVNSKFLLYRLSSKPAFDYARRTSAGTRMPRTSWNLFSNFEFDLPPLSEQRKIATVFYTIDRAIEQSKEIIEQTKRLKLGVSQHYFEDYDTVRREENPESVNMIELSELVEFKPGKAWKTDNLSEEGLKVVRISNLTGEKEDYWWYNGDYEQRRVIEDGDLLFSWAGMKSSIGVHLYRGEKALLNQHIYNLEPKSTIGRKYLYYYLDYRMSDLHSLSQGGAVQIHLTKDIIESILIPEVNSKERESIVSHLSEIDNALQNETCRKNQLRRLKRGLQQDLLSGTVRTTDTKIEVPDEIAQHG
ncbi:restriction endonuclease subunit S [Halorubrum ezzemoulense]|uniref:restriction endonuclease subunit S n=1 Tax=Halorubrum ezzemoulense TaxID=337243 RepID=UPI00232D9BD2|nr:restriction endonuclease subunit S [Halorubrum ezzemoulense]MDB9247917.1 restriction endonuclease subunit S [Halorubrum ezzemoulense]MDB9258174.1 restriction endonuclease subunit S [Halorubrum ezzemoulense]MDB9261464.1 restriction endonuclease subunit S [Halorubrum ezzemoulense]MDB9264967.1 restriction endonuclease subunit S [Halorubrum ezzemoulense]MDB9268535.1 restriction endonuclease subunit S [Halorubrum ezzemoulense]